MKKDHINILIVEDDDDLSRTVGEFLQTQFPCDIRICTSIAETIEVLYQEHFDVMLLDLNLPDAKGSSAVQRIQHMVTFPLVVFTAIDDQVVLDNVKGYGVVIISKPNVKSVVHVIDLAIKHRIRKLHERANTGIDTGSLEISPVNGAVD